MNNNIARRMKAPSFQQPVYSKHAPNTSRHIAKTTWHALARFSCAQTDERQASTYSALLLLQF